MPNRLPNTLFSHSARNIFQQQSHSANVQQPRSGVGQDNPAPPHARTATTQPASPKKAMRSRLLNTTLPRSQKQHNPRRKTVQLVLWVKPGVKAELQRLAEQEGLSVSATGAAFLAQALQHNLHTQHAALLDPIIDKAIGKHMRSYSTRLAVLLVRVAFASEQTRSLVTNILGRQPAVTQPMLEQILNGSSSVAKRNITRQTPQLAAIIDEVEQWFAEKESENNG